MITFMIDFWTDIEYLHSPFVTVKVLRVSTPKQTSDYNKNSPTTTHREQWYEQTMTTVEMMKQRPRTKDKKQKIPQQVTKETKMTLPNSHWALNKEQWNRARNKTPKKTRILKKLTLDDPSI